MRQMTSYEKAMEEVVAEYRQWLQEQSQKRTKMKVREVLDNLGLKGN